MEGSKGHDPVEGVVVSREWGVSPLCWGIFPRRLLSGQIQIFRCLSLRCADSFGEVSSIEDDSSLPTLLLVNPLLPVVDLQDEGTVSFFGRVSSALLTEGCC